MTTTPTESTAKNFSVREKTYNKSHAVRVGAPSEWAAERGATHTLVTNEPGTRPAKLLKTVLYVGIDEGPEETIVWEKWDIKPSFTFPF